MKQAKSSVRLETARAVLRELTPDDVPPLLELSADPEVTRFVDWPLKTAAEHEDFVRAVVASRSRTPRASYYFAVTDREDGTIYGFIRMKLAGPDADEADLGYYLLPRYWGRGLATEAARAVVGFGFERLGLRRIHAHCDIRNGASARVLEKIGMSREGTGRQETRTGPRDVFFYAASRRVR